MYIVFQLLQDPHFFTRVVSQFEKRFHLVNLIPAILFLLLKTPIFVSLKNDISSCSPSFIGLIPSFRLQLEQSPATVQSLHCTLRLLWKFQFIFQMKQNY